MSTKTGWVLLCLAMGCGLAIAWVDSRPTWDDTGITAGVVLLISAAFGFASPGRAWVWALAVGGWVPLLAIYRDGNYGGLLALVIAFAGAYSGALARRVLFAGRRPTSPSS